MIDDAATPAAYDRLLGIGLLFDVGALAVGGGAGKLAGGVALEFYPISGELHAALLNMDLAGVNRSAGLIVQVETVGLDFDRLVGVALLCHGGPSAPGQAGQRHGEQRRCERGRVSLHGVNSSRVIGVAGSCWAPSGGWWPRTLCDKRAWLSWIQASKRSPRMRWGGCWSSAGVSLQAWPVSASKCRMSVSSCQRSCGANKRASPDSIKGLPPGPRRPTWPLATHKRPSWSIRWASGVTARMTSS